MKNPLLILFGNQLFSSEHIDKSAARTVFMAESSRMCSRYRYHRHKLVLLLSAMRSCAEELRSKGYNVIYSKLADSGDSSWVSLLESHIDSHEYSELVHFEVESPGMNEALAALCAERGLPNRILDSPMFMTTVDEFSSYQASYKRLFMGDFYRWQRKRLHILLDDDGSPTGGAWSFDAENRKKLPKALVPPAIPVPTWTDHTHDVAQVVNRDFDDHPGDADDFWLPTTRTQAREALDLFLQERFSLFGDYEDALSSAHPFAYHSILSPLLNIGLLTPDHVVECALEFAQEHEVPINSVEGFVRQLIGWREFIRGIWRSLPPDHWQQNFWNHDAKLTSHWYEATTGIPPLDDAIRRARLRGYNHHIERLMVVGNLMLLCRISPKEAYRWFMEMYVDSADWVMAPNVFGMALFSEGGSFTTKPYICGSNYLRKMSDYPKGPWCDVVDGLYWSFVDEEQDFFAKNPRSQMMLRSLSKLDPARRQRIFDAASKFRQKVTTTRWP